MLLAIGDGQILTLIAWMAVAAIVGFLAGAIVDRTKLPLIGKLFK